MIAQIKLLAGVKWLWPAAVVAAGLGLIVVGFRGLQTLFPQLPEREDTEEAIAGDSLDDLKARYARGELSEVEFNAGRAFAHMTD